ncbi:hypothetical protein [Nonomuraea fuscirosea]|uniref:hypothetical protein n=1 Tax=Nonomuraea fuscirosea TaxID=1291556 RepID=UPI0034467FB0
MLTGATSRGLPQWSRRRSPGLAAVAVLLVFGGALATALLVMRAEERMSVARVAGRVGAGQSFGGGVLQEARIGGPVVVAEEAVIDSVSYRSGSADRATVIVDSVVVPLVAAHAVSGEIAIAAETSSADRG